MAVTFGDSTANSLMNALAAAGRYVSLHTADPGTTGADELSGDGYARATASWGEAADQAVANDAIVTFDAATAEWAEVFYVGLWSAASGGTFIAGAPLDTSITVPELGEAFFAEGELVFSLVAV